MSLTVHRGEILGLYGLVGAGRSEPARALLGLETITAGTLVGGTPAAAWCGTGPRTNCWRPTSTGSGCGSPARQLAGQLAGGNQQKASLAKWLAADCEILIIDEPTVGIDVRTKAAFRELIAELATSGIAIVLVSSDLPEMITLADRTLVMRELAIVGEVTNDDHYTGTSQAVIRLVHAETAA